MCYTQAMKNIEYKPTNYPSDLTDVQWEIIAGFFPMGNKGEAHKRSLVEAVLYLVDNGCKWRALPHDYPKWSTVKSFYYRAVETGTWEKAMRFLVGETRKKAGRKESPSYALIDSQSVKTIYASDERGFDGGKNERAEAAYSHGHNGQSACCVSSCGEYSRHRVWSHPRNASL
jgi:putative transposase